MQEDVLCPVCKTPVREDESVAMLLIPAEATQLQRAHAQSLLVRICPKCRILFLDDDAYSWAKDLIQND